MYILAQCTRDLTTGSACSLFTYIGMLPEMFPNIFGGSSLVSRSRGPAAISGTILAPSTSLFRRQQDLEEGTLFDDDLEDDFKKGTGLKRFDYGELTTTTNNFSNEHKLGEGGFGSVYRGFLAEMSLAVAIKRVSKSSKKGRKEYTSEVRIISRL
ncbi:hypothetical protein PR202_ga11905 [Eleusine coracana subsp. coracana]|uniref:Protein kinase domain-containing protein n=1 Tax=Eleusine coracana subsp. coracana TaxID=191504 RepID=A0AAV5CA75_ELECO|nr:hypothetical protein PR202_ga11905 [Eleusine coracana subsp. coracana]